MANGKHGGNVWEGGNPARWLDFSANLRPEGPPEWVTRILREALCDVRYYPDRDMTAARHGLAAYAGVPETCILPTAGGAAAIDLALSQRRGAVYPLPVTFGEYASRAAIHGRRVEKWQGMCAPGETFVRCNPNNPTGGCLTREAVLSEHAQVARQGGEMIVDEAFIDFCPEHSVRRDVQPGLIAVGSLTKTLCIPGVRLGYICADPETLSGLAHRAMPWAVGTLACAVAAGLPEHLEEIRRDSAVNAARREAFARRLTLLGAKPMPSQANFLLVDFCRDMTRVAEKLREDGILVRGCASFGLPGRFLRLAVRTEKENERLLNRLEELLDAR